MDKLKLLKLFNFDKSKQ